MKLKGRKPKNDLEDRLVDQKFVFTGKHIEVSDELLEKLDCNTADRYNTIVRYNCKVESAVLANSETYGSDKIIHTRGRGGFSVKDEQDMKWFQKVAETHIESIFKDELGKDSQVVFKDISYPIYQAFDTPIKLNQTYQEYDVAIGKISVEASGFIFYKTKPKDKEAE